MLRARILSSLILACVTVGPGLPPSARANEPTRSEPIRSDPPLPALPQSASPQSTLPQSGAVLEKVLLVSRHGIRSPTRSRRKLDKTTGRAWSVWPVPPGELTDHGRANLALMGQFLQNWYAPLLPPAPTSASSPACAAASAVFVWADSADTRTRQSGDILAQALTPCCASTAHGLPAGRHDPLFNALAAGQARLDRQRVMPALTQAFQQDSLPDSIAAKAATALQAAFAPNGCQQRKGPCFSAPTVLSWKKGKPQSTGGLNLSASTAENLFLEYVEGLPSTVFAHTPATSEPATPEQDAAATRQLLTDTLPAHALLSDRLRRLPAIALPRGHVLATTLIESLAGQPVSLPDASPLPAPARLILFAGHDTTLDMLATLFGLDWSFSDQPDRTAPDTTLAFELWRLPDGQKDVRFRIFHQSLEQLRQTQPMTGQTAPHLLRSQFCPLSGQAQCSPEALARGLQTLTEHFL